MPDIYRDISALINNAVWDTMVSDNKDMIIPYYYRKHPEFAPLYEGDGGMSHSKITIHHMIELCTDGTTFVINTGEDTISIYKYLVDYMKIIAENIIDLDKTHEYVRYFTKCKVAEKVLREMAEQSMRMETRDQVFEELPQITDLINML